MKAQRQLNAEVCPGRTRAEVTFPGQRGRLRNVDPIWESPGLSGSDRFFSVLSLELQGRHRALGTGKRRSWHTKRLSAPLPGLLSNNSNSKGMAVSPTWGQMALRQVKRHARATPVPDHHCWSTLHCTGRVCAAVSPVSRGH